MRCQVALGVLVVERETIIQYFLYQHTTPLSLYDPFATAHVRARTHNMPRVLYTMYDHLHVTHSNYRPKSPLTKFIVCCVLLRRLTVTSRLGHFSLLKYLQQSTPLLLTSSKSPSVTLPDLLDKALFTFFT